MATLKFRHDFYANQEFPLDVNDQVIRKCAEHFCDDDSTKGVDSFFLKNQEAIDNKYPFLPDDRGFIVKTLSQLLCQQELNRRRNIEQKARNNNLEMRGWIEEGSDVESELTSLSDGSSEYETGGERHFTGKRQTQHHSRIHETMAATLPTELVSDKNKSATPQKRAVEDTPESKKRQKNASCGDTGSKVYHSLYAQSIPVSLASAGIDTIVVATGPTASSSITQLQDSQINHQTNPKITTAVNETTISITNQPAIVAQLNQSQVVDSAVPMFNCPEGNTLFALLDQTHPNKPGFPIAYNNTQPISPVDLTQASSSQLTTTQQPPVTHDVSVDTHIATFSQLSKPTVGEQAPRIEQVADCIRQFEFQQPQQAQQTREPQQFQQQQQRPQPTSQRPTRPIPSPSPSIPQFSEPPANSPHTERDVPGITLKICNAYGALDFNSDFPSKHLHGSVDSFFKIYSEASRIPVTLIPQLNFIVHFAKDTILEVRRGDSEAVWERLKWRLSSLYSVAIEKEPRVIEFEVWIEVVEGLEIQRGNRDGFAGF